MMANRSYRVLLIDDDEQIRRLFARAFTAAGYEFDTAGNAVEGLERARSWHPDLALVDLRMPAISGDELAAVLRVHPATREAILVAFSGYVDEAHLPRLREEGFDAVMPKTLSAQSIVARVGELLARGADDPPDAPGASPRDRSHEPLHGITFPTGRAATGFVDTFRQALSDPAVHAQTPAGPLVIYGSRSLAGNEPVLLWVTSGVLRSAELIGLALPQPTAMLPDASRLPFDTLVLFATLGGRGSEPR